MKKLQGFRTLIFNIIAVIAAWLAQNFDLPISVEHQVAIGTTIIAIGNITLRFLTKTPIGKKQEAKIAPKLVHELAEKQNARHC